MTNKKRGKMKKAEKLGLCLGTLFPIFMIIFYSAIMLYAIYCQSLTNKSNLILLLTHPLLIILLTSAGIAQVLKMIVTSVREGKFTPFAIFQEAGMPSTHTAGIISIIAGCYYLWGIDIIFILWVIIGIYMLEDILTKERGVDENADILWRFMLRFPEKIRKKFEYKHQHIKLAHTWSEVFFGGIVGITVVKLSLYNMYYVVALFVAIILITTIYFSSRWLISKLR